MKATQQLREQLGLSQQDLAQYLSITVSLLGMYEIGKRDLPTAALVKLAAIELLLNQKEFSFDELNFLEQNQVLHVKEILKKQEERLRFKQMKAQRSLDEVMKKYNQSSNLFRLAKDNTTPPATQMVALLQQATHGIEDYGVVTQLQLKIKLQEITSQLEYVRQQIEMYEKS